MNRPLTVLTIDNLSPTDSAYPYSGVFALVFKEENRTGGLKQFIDFATSSAAAEAIKKAGGLPVLLSRR
jgi:ABC-type phosphate transport system substrate-binding protein